MSLNPCSPSLSLLLWPCKGEIGPTPSFPALTPEFFLINLLLPVTGVQCRVIASQASVPLVYVPLEALSSKWYGESERLLAQVFKAAELLPGCIIFLDEVDSLATSR